MIWEVMRFRSSHVDAQLLLGIKFCVHAIFISKTIPLDVHFKF